MQKVSKKQKANNPLPSIPEKVYFTIGEVGKLCELKPHVLRYWEQEFTQLSPSKRRGNRRYYQRKEVLLVRKIKSLLYTEGFTIEGAKSQLLSENSTVETTRVNVPADNKAETIKLITKKLEDLLKELEA